MRRTECGGCGGTDLEVFLELGETPLANTLLTDNVGEAWYPLDVAVCATCQLSQLMDVVPDDELFGGDYAFYSSTSPALVRYHAEQATQLLRHHHTLAERLTVEIGSNDGDMLRHFRDAGCQTLGVDPAKAPSEVARGRDLRIWTESFGRGVAERILEEVGTAGLIVANNVAAHVADLRDLLGGVAALLADDGFAVVEVQYLADLLLGNQFDHVYHEHRYFFSVTSMREVCRRVGLYVVNVEQTAPQGGSVRFTLSRYPTVPSPIGEPDERWLREPGTYRSFQGRVNRVRQKLVDLVQREHDAGHSVAGWTAPAKAVTLLNFCGIGSDEIGHITDNSPSKQGRLLPGTGIPIVPRGVLPAPDTLLALGWSYLGSMLHQERDFVDGGGRIIVPIPNPVVL